MKKEEEKYLRDVIDHFIDFYGFDLNPYSRAYNIWFEKKMYNEIIVDFLKRVRLPANIRLIKAVTSTEENPSCVGYIALDVKNPLYFMSAEFKRTRYEIKIDPSQYEKFEKFICTLIHELAHLVLHSTHNKYRMSEVATDLFVMTYGLYTEHVWIMMRMQKTPGYITRDQTMYAHKYILSKRKCANASAFTHFLQNIRFQLFG